MVGHLREEKDPRTYWAAVRGLAGRGDLRFDHVGAALDARLGEEAQALATAHARFRWLGGLPHEATRRRIQAAHLLVHPSRMEGGAHVIIEALRSGTPVLASAIDGNVGLLGEDHAGLFAPGDAAGLSRLLVRARDEAGLLAHLTAQGAAKADRFAPAAERAALLACVHHLLDP
jgi:glycosyltransferase involved in cell wall biosynthesis